MPSVRTESQPTAAAKTVASEHARRRTASHHGQPRLIAAMLLLPKIATT